MSPNYYTTGYVMFVLWCIYLVLNILFFEEPDRVGLSSSSKVQPIKSREETTTNATSEIAIIKVVVDAVLWVFYLYYYNTTMCCLLILASYVQSKKASSQTNLSLLAEWHVRNYLCSRIVYSTTNSIKQCLGFQVPEFSLYHR